MPNDSFLPPIGDAEDTPSLAPLDVTALQDEKDPWRRSRLAEESAKHLRVLVEFALRIRQEAVRELVDEHGAHHTRVARHLGVSRARVGQLVTPSATQRSEAEVSGSQVIA